MGDWRQLVGGDAPKLLVVDDEQHNLELIERALRNRYQVLAATSGADAMALLGDHPDVFMVLSDQRMSPVDGTALMKYAQQYVPYAVRAMISAYADYQVLMDAINDGAIHRFLRKPVSPAEIVAVVDEAFARFGQQTIIGAPGAPRAWGPPIPARDPISGAWNAQYFHDRLREETQRAQRHQRALSLLVVNIDFFRAYNEANGYLSGHQLLRDAAELVRGTARGVPGVRSSDVVARFGGDQFLIVLPETELEGALGVAERIRAAFEAHAFPGRDSQPHGHVTVSVGAASAPPADLDPESLTAAAETGLAIAKRRGGNQVVAFTSGRDGEELDRDSVPDYRDLALEKTIVARRFTFALQPILDLQSMEPLAVEALCRPLNKAFPTPTSLFRTAERTGRVVELGRAIRESVWKLVEELPAEQLLFVNVHPFELGDLAGNLPSSLLASVSRRIVLELTEVAAIEDFVTCRKLLDELRTAGFRLALDDFGAGYSGLRSLTELAPEFVKIDMSLVQQLRHSPHTALLFKHVLDYGSERGFSVIAEGIETAEDLASVRELGCQFAQGFHLGMPSRLSDEPSAVDSERSAG